MYFLVGIGVSNKLAQGISSLYDNMCILKVQFDTLCKKIGDVRDAARIDLDNSSINNGKTLSFLNPELDRWAFAKGVCNTSPKFLFSIYTVVEMQPHTSNLPIAIVNTQDGQKHRKQPAFGVFASGIGTFMSLIGTTSTVHTESPRNIQCTAQLHKVRPLK